MHPNVHAPNKKHHIDTTMATTQSPFTAESPHTGRYGYRESLSNNSGLGPNDTLILIAVFSAFTFFPVCYLCVRRYIGAGASPAPPASTQQPARTGLDKELVESFPTMLYSEVRHFNLRRGTLECAVCLSEFDDADTLRLLPRCSHAFHPDCIDMWLDSHTTCPVCRADLRASPDPHAAAPETPPVQVLVPEDEEESEARGEVSVWTAQERERFTLRLPETLRVELSSRSLSRSVTMDCRSLRKGKRGPGGWSFDLDRLGFLGRTPSLPSPRGGGGRTVVGSSRDEGESPADATRLYR